jgi:superfamily II DNA or RNA helicase
VQVVSIQTLSSRLKKGWIPPKPKFLISDECHHACSSSWLSVFDAFKDVPTLGVTATPCRLDGKGLGAVFDRLVLGPTPARLMDEGYLVRPQYWGVPVSQLPDIEGIGTVGGDFNKAALSKAVEDKPRLTGDVVAHYKRRANGLKFVGFACNVKHANTLRDAFVVAEIPCEVIHGGLSDEERADMVGRLDSGEIRGLWSVDLISEGFDLPEVSCAILCRPTNSLSLHLQQLGRVLRLSEGKRFAVILDHAGNIMRDGLGSAEMDREWSLDGIKKVKRDTETLPAICQCPKCFAVFLRAPSCPRCEYVFPVVERKIKSVAGTLKQLSAKEIEDAQRRMKLRQAQGMAQTLDQLMSFAVANGRSRQWAFRVWEARKATEAKKLIDSQLLESGRKIN